MSQPSAEVSYTDIHLERSDLRNVFDELAGLAGAAILGGRAIQCALQLETRYESGSPSWRCGGFALRAVGSSPEQPGMQFAVSAEGDGVYTENPSDIAGQKNFYRSLTGLTQSVRQAKSLRANTILSQARDIVAAAPTLDTETTEWYVQPNYSMLTLLRGPVFVPVVGQLLRLTEEGLRYDQIEVAVDTAQQILLGQYGQAHSFRSFAASQKGTGLNFSLDHTHTDPRRTDETQIVALDCDVAIRPESSRQGQNIGQALDLLRNAPEDDQRSHRTRGTYSRVPQRFYDLVDTRPIEAGDIVDLARSTLDPASYLEKYWPDRDL